MDRQMCEALHAVMRKNGANVSQVWSSWCVDVNFKKELKGHG